MIYLFNLCNYVKLKMDLSVCVSGIKHFFFIRRRAFCVVCLTYSIPYKVLFLLDNIDPSILLFNRKRYNLTWIYYNFFT